MKKEMKEIEAIPMPAGPGRELSREEKRQRLSLLSEEEWMRWSYVPFCVAEGAWDYADTALNLAAQLRLEGAKKLCRAVRELRRSYVRRRQAHAVGGSGKEMENFLVIERESGRSFAHLYECIRQSAQRQHPGLLEAHRQYLEAVYACKAVLDALYKYMSMQEAHICRACGFSEVSSILPSEVHALRQLVPELAGDKPVRVKGRGLFTYNIAKALMGVRLEGKGGMALKGDVYVDDRGGRTAGNGE